MAQYTLPPSDTLVRDMDLAITNSLALDRTASTHEPSWPDGLNVSATTAAPCPPDDDDPDDDDTGSGTAGLPAMTGATGKKNRRKRVTAEHTRQRVRDNQRRHRAQQRMRLEELESLACENKATIDQLRAEVAALKSEMERCGRHSTILATSGPGVLVQAFAKTAAPSNSSIDSTAAAFTGSNMIASNARGAQGLQQVAAQPPEQLLLSQYPFEAALVRQSPLHNSPMFSNSLEASGATNPEALMIDPNPRIEVFPMTPPEMNYFMNQTLSRISKVKRPSCARSTSTCCTDDDLAIISLSLGTPTLSLPLRPNSSSSSADGTSSSCVLGPRCCADDLPPVLEAGSLSADTREANDGREEADEFEELVCSQPEIHGSHLPKKILQAATTDDSGTTPCTQAVIMVMQQNFKGVSKQLIESWLEDGFRRAPNEEGCRIENGRLYSLLAFMSE
ncbi:uncharacterized protein BROUX77_003035 [Berkeleyomyces rouxiae]|uniref:uncharacterized protein n=1 Tax=Berkeleyomyces rouxiae TaxID=2035830 RepID=UPI003B7DE57D